MMCNLATEPFEIKRKRKKKKQKKTQQGDFGPMILPRSFKRPKERERVSSFKKYAIKMDC